MDYEIWINKAIMKIGELECNTEFILKDLFSGIEWNKLARGEKTNLGRKFKENVDIIVGGSPCQAFSSNGKRAGLEDTRGTLFYEYARVIKESQPKCFIFENV